MRLSELITNLDQDELHELAVRVVPGATELDASLWSRNLEFVLGQTGYVEQAILAGRPPVASLLLRLVDAPDHVLTVDEVRPEILDEVELWCQQVTAGELANRIPDRSLIYRRMLEAAWRNDLTLDASEVRLLRLLRDELGLLRIEHFLLAHHSSIQPYWQNDDAMEPVIEALQNHGIVYVPEPGQLALPDELVPHVRKALGVSLSRDAARRLLQHLDSGSHLKSALEDHELPTSGSKQERINRLVDSFVPMNRVVDTMHILDARELARRLGIQVSGSKDELVQRIVGHFAAGSDLAAGDDDETESAAEEKALSQAGFAALFEGLKGHQLQQLLMAFAIRHSGSKQVRISTLWESPLSEATLLSKLKNPELNDLLAKSDLVCRGSKANKIDALIDAFRTFEEAAVQQEPDEVEGHDEVDPITEDVLGEVVELLGGIELSSKSPNRFHQVRDGLARRLELDATDVAIKWLGGAKNHRNRIGEALRAQPKLLLLLAPREDGDSVLEAARSRLTVSANTHFATLLRSEGAGWACGTIMSAVETPLVDGLTRVFPDAEIQLVGFPSSVQDVQVRELVERTEHELEIEWTRSDAPAEVRVRRGLIRAFGRPDTVIRTKHISDGRNVGNRISEAVGAGCGALVLFVAHELAGAARAEAVRQLSSVREPVLAVVIAEADDGGYLQPEVVTGVDEGNLTST